MYLKSSEFVGVGHPDKLADQISDSVVDYCRSLNNYDPTVRVACETLVTAGQVFVAGEIRMEIVPTPEALDVVIREAIAAAGYTDPTIGFDSKSVVIHQMLKPQSNDIAKGVDSSADTNDIGAGDQGIMVGYAINESPNFLPASYYLSAMILKSLNEKIISGELQGLLTDNKAQVCVRYEDGNILPVVSRVLVSCMHKEYLSLDEVRVLVMSVIDGVLAANPQFVSDVTEIEFLINPTGRFVEGGPVADTGLTGRKIIVDTYGGYAPHGGGAFCFAGDTKVKTSAGYKEIKDIVEGDLVWTSDDKGFLRLNPVNEVFFKSVEDSYDLLEIELENGTKIKVTDQHEFYTKNRGWIMARDLTESDEIYEFSDGRIHGSKLRVEYFMSQGLSYEEAVATISASQRSKSPLCIDYYTERGISTLDAMESITKLQRKNSPACIEYYLEKGYSEEEGLLLLSKYQGSTRSKFSDEDWKNFCLTNGHSLEAYIYREGEMNGPISYRNNGSKISIGITAYQNGLTTEQRNEIYGNPGSSNGMYNRLPGHAAGNGISGYYKGYLFRSLLELTAMLHLESSNIKYRANEVQDSNTPEIGLEYKIGSEIMKYYPDLLLLDDNDLVTGYIEVKPLDFLDIFEDFKSSNLSEYDIKILSTDVLDYDKALIAQLEAQGDIIIHESKMTKFSNFLNY